GVALRRLDVPHVLPGLHRLLQAEPPHSSVAPAALASAAPKPSVVSAAHLWGSLVMTTPLRLASQAARRLAITSVRLVRGLRHGRMSSQRHTFRRLDMDAADRDRHIHRLGSALPRTPLR